MPRREPAWWLRGVLLSAIVVVTLLLIINVRDAALLKLPAAWAFCSLLAAAALAVALGSRTAVLPATRADIPVLLTLLLALAGFLLVPRPRLAEPAVLLTAVCTIAFFAGAHLFAAREEVETLVTTVAATAAAVAGVALIQFFLHDRLGVEFFLGSDMRVGSTLGNPVFLGGWIVLTAPLLFADLTQRPRRSARGIAIAVLLAVLVLVLFLTRTRSSIVALPVGLLVFLAMRGSRRGRTFVFAVAGLAGLALLAAAFVPGVFGRIASLTDPAGGTFARRVPIWVAGWRAFLASPVVGHGPGRFEHVMRDFRGPDYWLTGSEDVVPHAHNEFLEIAVDGGVLGLALFLWVLVAAFRAALRGRVEASPWRRSMIAGVVAGLAALLVDNVANVSLRQAPVALLAWISIGLLFSPALGLRRAEGSGARFRLPAIHPAVPLGVWAACMVWYGVGVAAHVRAEKSEIRGVLAAVRNEQGREAGYYAAAAEADPLYLEALFNTAASLVFGGKPAEALVYAGRLTHLAPNYPKVGLVEAAAFYQLDSLDVALRSIGTELARRSHPEAWYIAAKIHEARGDRTAEHAALEALLRQGARGATPAYAGDAVRRLCLLCATPGEPGHTLELTRALAARLPRSREAAAALATVDSCSGMPAQSTTVQR